MVTTIQKLEDAKIPDPRGGWVVTFSVTLLAFLLRFVGISKPNKIIFDETYYAKDAYSLLLNGIELEWPKRDIANSKIIAGHPDQLLQTPEFIAHPPLGKWLIALGEHWFGMNPFGWRFMACIFGTLLVFFTIRMARRLSRSTLIGAIAGLLLTFDGLAFTMSRIALLDIFQATFAVAAISALLADRDDYRQKLAKYLRSEKIPNLAGHYGPLWVFRPWRLLAGVLFGLSIGCKWNSVYFLAVFGILSVIWDLQARHLAGAKNATWLSLLFDAPLAFCRIVVVAAITYVSTWVGWLTKPNGWGRDWGKNNPHSPLVAWLGEALASLVKYHIAIYDFHVSDATKKWTHPYAANPLGWLIMARPIGLSAENDIKPPAQGCHAVGTTCLRVISGMGTPILWWLAAAALIVGCFFWLWKKDWRFSVPILAVLAIWLPWFHYAQRPLFFFYAIMIIPFSVTVLAMVMGKILGAKNDRKRKKGAIAVGLMIALVIFNFAFIYPVLTDQLLTRPQWLARMWFRSWI